MAPEIHKIPEKLEVVLETDKPIVFSADQALYDKTVPIPLPTGGLQRGILWFRTKQARREDIDRPGTKFILSYEDVSTKRYAVEWVLPTAIGKPGYFPALTSLPTQR